MRDYLTEAPTARTPKVHFIHFGEPRIAEGAVALATEGVPNLRKTNFLNSPINPNLSYNIRTNYVGATIGRPRFQILICGLDSLR